MNHWRIKQAVAESDLVAIGKVTRKISALTENKGFVVTDSEFLISDILMSRKKAGPAIGSVITVATPGGTVVLDGHHITASLANDRLITNGDQYVLFLKYLPDSGSYMPTSLFGFDTTGPTVVPMLTTIAPPAEKFFSNPTLFIQAVRSSTNHQMAEEQK
jgi:hypothetical protein